jgi:hypothetical protein
MSRHDPSGLPRHAVTYVAEERQKSVPDHIAAGGSVHGRRKIVGQTTVFITGL